MDTIKDRIEFLSSYLRALPIAELERELGLKRGTIENCDKVPMSPEAIQKVADRLNSTPEQLNGEPTKPYVRPKIKWD